MPKYRIRVSWVKEYFGYTTIEAESLEQARQTACKLLDEKPPEQLVDEAYECTDSSDIRYTVCPTWEE